MLITLLNHGALLCSKDNQGVTPLQLLKNRKTKINVMNFINLKCLSIKALNDYKINVRSEEVGPQCTSLFSLHA